VRAVIFSISGVTSPSITGQQLPIIGSTVSRLAAAILLHSPNPDRLGRTLPRRLGCWSSPRWLVLYQLEAADVRIARIVDAARNLGELDLSGE
jgi:hypothetical protein